MTTRSGGYPRPRTANFRCHTEVPCHVPPSRRGRFALPLRGRCVRAGVRNGRRVHGGNRGGESDAGRGRHGVVEGPAHHRRPRREAARRVHPAGHVRDAARGARAGRARDRPRRQPRPCRARPEPGRVHQGGRHQFRDRRGERRHAAVRDGSQVRPRVQDRRPGCRRPERHAWRRRGGSLPEDRPHLRHRPEPATGLALRLVEAAPCRRTCRLAVPHRGWTGRSGPARRSSRLRI